MLERSVSAYLARIADADRCRCRCFVVFSRERERRSVRERSEGHRSWSSRVRVSNLAPSRGWRNRPRDSKATRAASECVKGACTSKRRADRSLRFVLRSVDRRLDSTRLRAMIVQGLLSASSESGERYATFDNIRDM